MALRHPLAGLIWAAVLVIAVQFAPNLAFAHVGHDHHSTGMVTSTQAKAPDVGASEATGQKYLQVAAVVTESARPCSSCPGGTSGCSGKCCGTGMCCGAAVIQAPAPALPVAGLSLEVVWPIVDGRAGIDPDGLTRPPKILA
jgi:hypothetical protein